jgi:hypothetical protein
MRLDIYQARWLQHSYGLNLQPRIRWDWLSTNGCVWYMGTLKQAGQPRSVYACGGMAAVVQYLEKWHAFSLFHLRPRHAQVLAQLTKLRSRGRTSRYLLYSVIDMPLTPGEVLCVTFLILQDQA